MTTATEAPALRFSSYHLKYDPELHKAAWGARLIYREVEDGGGGVVWDRQDALGDKAELEAIVFPEVERFTKVLQYLMRYDWNLKMSSMDRWVWHGFEHPVVIAASPQGSGGYLYMTAVLEKVGGLTRLRPLDDEDDQIEYTFDMLAGCEWFDTERADLEGRIEYNREYGLKGNRELRKRLKELNALFLGEAA